MKKIVTILCVATLIFASCSKEDSYTITGDINGLKDNMVVLNVWNGKMQAIDTAYSNNGKFVFTGKIDSPDQYYITGNSLKSMIPVFVENSEIYISADISKLKDVEIQGSTSQDLYDSYVDKKKLIQGQLDSIGALYDEAEKINDAIELKRLGAQYDSVKPFVRNVIIDFINENNKSAVSLFIIDEALIYQITPEELQPIVDNFDESIHQSKYYKSLTKWLKNQQRVAIGQPFVDISMPDTTGTMLSLSSFKGKWILLDFWSTRCPPCRKENPKLAKLYKKYNESGFEIFSVSFDRTKEEWQKSMAKDGVIWTQVSELKGWNNQARTDYCIETLPHLILINPEGIIVQKEGLRGEELEEKMKEIFKF